MAKNYKFHGLLATILVVAGLSMLAATAGVARADGNAPTVSAWAYSPVSTHVTGVARVRLVAKLHGKIQVRAWMPKGLPKAQQHNCHWVTGGTNTYKGANGQTYNINWAGKRAYICPSASSPTGWRKAGGPPNWDNCGNVFYPPTEKQPRRRLKPSQIVEVQQFTYTWKLTLRSYLSATASAWANCHLGTAAAAAAYSYASGYGYVDTAFTAAGRSRSQVTAKGTRIHLTQSQYQTLVGRAQANVRLNLSAAARATCSGQAPPSPSTPPGVPTPPSPPSPSPPPPCTSNCTPPPPAVCPPNTNGTPPNCVPGKNGEEGPGQGTPGQPGGSGAGGQPGSGSGPMCRDSSGNLVPGEPVDANGDCAGVSDSGTTGSSGPAPSSPPPPPPSMCIDPNTGQDVEGTPDQFGYCT